ncbi:MAG: AI-2E family transporter [Planctomycetota bacterium]
MGAILTAIAQGILAGIGYACVWGTESLFMLVILTTIAAMIPFFGAGLIWVPVCVHLAFVEERFPAAIGLGLYGFFIISMADNIIKPWVLKGQSNLHPLFALLSVLGGVQALGPIGVLVGPMIVAFLQSLLNILHRDLKRMDELRSEAA